MPPKPLSRNGTKASVGQPVEDNQHSQIDWRGDVPVARRFDDPYFSLENGLAETRHVFLAGNGLPTRFRPGFHIAELGFGTGLNALAAVASWDDAGIDGPLHFTSFEEFPMSVDAMERALSAYPELDIWKVPMMEEFRSGTLKVRSNSLILNVILGDARMTVPKWAQMADAWFLDGFAPAKNPELWEPGLMAEVGRHTKKGGTAATYSAAGHVRSALVDAGFDVERIPGFGRKRHMTVARK